MKALTKTEIYNKVRALLDETAENDADFILTDKDSTELNAIIDEVALLSVRNVHLGAPYWMLDGETVSETDLKDFKVGDDLVATLSLPKEFLRLVKVKLPSWSAPVTKVITEDSPEYRMQANKYMRGTAAKPVCALVLLANDTRGLELYSATETDDEVSLIILKEPVWSADGEINICPRLENAIIAQITGQTLLALGENERAQTYLSLSTNYSQQ